MTTAVIAARTYVVALVLGAATGVVAVAFLGLVHGLEHLVWDVLPEHVDAIAARPELAVVLTCTVGGVLVGLINRGLARRASSAEIHDLETALDEDDAPTSSTGLARTAALGIVSLGFGASLGPEAPLIVLVGGLAARAARLLHLARDEAVQLSVSAAVGGLFGGPIGAVALPVEGSQDVATRLRRLGPALVSALAGFWVLVSLLPSGSFEPFQLPDGLVPASDDVVALLLLPAGAALLGVAGGLALHRLLPLAHRAVAAVPGGPVPAATAGGLVLGLCGAVDHLTLFSGHHETQQVLDDLAGYGALALLGLAVLKLLATLACLATGWSGGEIFPAVMVGAALGLTVAATADLTAAAGCLAAGVTGAAGVAMRRPVAALLILLLFLPAGSWAAAALGAAGAALALRLTEHPAAGERPTPDQAVS